MKSLLLILLLSLTAAFSMKCGAVYGQVQDMNNGVQDTEAIQSIRAGNQYMDARIASLGTYIQHYALIQQRLVRKLNKQGRGFSALPASPGSLPDTFYKRHSVSYDSLLTLAKDPSLLYNKGSPKSNAVIDSLKGIQDFLQHQSGKLQNVVAIADKANFPAGSYTAKLNELQQKLSAQEQLNGLIHQKAASLQCQAGAQAIPGLQSIQKDIAIAESKIKCWKQTADDPDAAEEKAYEYLQGTEGFSSYLNNNKNAFGGLGNDASAADLQRMGYQLKGDVAGMLQQQFGDRLSSVQQQMGKQVSAYTKQLNDIKSKVAEAQNAYAQGKQGLVQAGDQLGHLERPAFRNPMRGIPFLQRLEMRYDFQSTRAAGSRPALLHLGASLAFKQTPKFSMGLGISADLGMGRDWQHLKLSYEGLGLRAFLDREMLYGISLEGGYERLFRPADRPYLGTGATQPDEGAANKSLFKTAFGGQQQSVYLGLMKSYHINSKWNGTFLIGYDFLWQRYGLRTPLMVRLGWSGH